jgi:hypothetical protein
MDVTPEHFDAGAGAVGGAPKFNEKFAAFGVPTPTT